MALIVKDRVQELSTTVGTGTLTLGGATLGFQSFAAIGDGNTTYYAINDPLTGDWEAGIGTYTASGTTLSRDTVLSSSNGGSLVSFVAGSKNVFCTYPSERAVYLDSAGAYPVQNTFNTLNVTTATITSGTVSTTPSAGNDIANKTYVDTAVSSGIHFHDSVRVESPVNLNATYNQPGGAGVGVGATLTNAGTQVALVIDGVTMAVNDRVLIHQQTTLTENGVYVVTDVGSGSTNWVLTRSADADTYVVTSSNGLGEGSAFFVQQGTIGAGGTFVCITPGTITFGTTNIIFALVSSAQIYSAGTGLTLSGTTFSITDTGIAGTYGGANSVPVITTNAQGQVTSVSPTTIAISSAAVSGLAASATTDTTNASNISSGTLGTSRLSGSYTGITGVGALAAGSLASGFTAVSAPLGGTGQTSYAVGDILYANTTTSLARLADVAVGNALISGGVAAAPSYGKIGLATHVSGTLPVANGGSGATTAQGGMNAFAGAVTSGQYLRGNGTNVVMSAIQAADVPTLNQNTTGNAATVTNGLYTNAVQTNTANKSFQASNSGIATSTGGLNTLEVIGTGGAAMMTFHRPAAFAAYFGLDSDNVWKVGGWSYGAASYPLLYTGSTTAPGSAPVYAARAWVNFDGSANSNLTGTYARTSPSTTVTVTITAHGLKTGDEVFLDFTSGTGVDGEYTATVTGLNTFTVTTVASTTTSGNVTLRRNTIRASGNVSSISDNSAGEYSVNFAVAMPDENYAVTGTAQRTPGLTDAAVIATDGQTAAAFKFVIEDVDAGAVDPPVVAIVVHR